MNISFAPTRSRAETDLAAIGGFMASRAEYDNITVNKTVTTGYTTHTYGTYVVRAAVVSGSVEVVARDIKSGNSAQWTNVTAEQFADITTALI